jgi:hypothetical protein
MSTPEAEVLADYADARVPYVTDNPDTPVPLALTPQAEAEVDTWTGPAPDPRELAVARDVWARPAMEPADPEFDAGWQAAHRDYCACDEPDAARCPELEAG